MLITITGAKLIQALLQTMSREFRMELKQSMRKTFSFKHAYTHQTAHKATAKHKDQDGPDDYRAHLNEVPRRQNRACVRIYNDCLSLTVVSD